jgi:hypothetical protein
MSIACRATDANLYYIQPLLADTDKTFHVNQLSINFAAMLTQIDYAVGFTSIIPQLIIPLTAQLPDPKQRRQIIGTIMSSLLVTCSI